MKIDLLARVRGLIGPIFQIKKRTMLAKFKEDLSELLGTALQQCADSVVRDFADKSVYAFVVYPSSGFVDFGVAISTREDLPEGADVESSGMDAELLEKLKDHPDLLAKVQNEKYPPAILIASEWKFGRCYQGYFDSLNELILQRYDKLYDAGVSPYEIECLFSEVVIGSVNALKSQGYLSKRPFEEDLLLGIQFPDSLIDSVSIGASEALNSPIWHKKLLRYLPDTE